jgi:predicted RNA-binding protein
MVVKYWVVVASKDHVMHGVSLGIAQSGHGKRTRLEKMHKGDGIVYYSPKAEFDGNEPLHAFTAIGEVADEEIFQVEESPDFRPFRRKVRYLRTGEVKIEPLINELDFIRDKRSWGFTFKYGLVEIDRKDFKRISEGFLKVV